MSSASIKEKFMESDTHISQESSQKITCPFCGAIVQAKDEFCTNCGSDLTNSQSSSEAPQKKLTNAKNVKPESIQSVRQEKQIVLSIAAVLLIALGFFGYRGSTSTKKGFALSGAAGAGEESQNPSVNSRAAAPSESSESPSVNMPSLNADPVIADRI
jgi:hypothetical protein